MRCAKCRRECLLAWHIDTSKWRLLAKKWWDKVLCIECFVMLVSHRQSNRVLLMPEDFDTIVIAARRVRGYLNRKPKNPLFVR